MPSFRPSLWRRKRTTATPAKTKRKRLVRSPLLTEDTGLFYVFVCVVRCLPDSGMVYARVFIVVSEACLRLCSVLLVVISTCCAPQGYCCCRSCLHGLIDTVCSCGHKLRSNDLQERHTIITLQNLTSLTVNILRVVA